MALRYIYVLLIVHTFYFLNSYKDWPSLSSFLLQSFSPDGKSQFVRLEFSSCIVHVCTLSLLRMVFFSMTSHSLS